MLPEKGLRQDETADGEEEQNAAATAVDQAQGEVLLQRGDGESSAGNRLSQNVREESRNDSDEAQTVDLGDPATMRRDTAKFHCVLGEGLSDLRNEIADRVQASG
jgi:hypothetical protein